MSALTTTFKELHEWSACRPSYRKLAKGLGGIRTYGRTTPIKLSQILDICGIDDCFWVLERATLDKSYARELELFRCDCAERVLPIFEDEYPGDSRPRAAIETARRFADGEATTMELAAARAAARAAFWDADYDPARAAVRAASATMEARTPGASRASWIAWTARAAKVARAARAARAAARNAERTAQTQMLRNVLVKLEARDVTPPTEEPKT